MKNKLSGKPSDQPHRKESIQDSSSKYARIKDYIPAAALFISIMAAIVSTTSVFISNKNYQISNRPILIQLVRYDEVARSVRVSIENVGNGLAENLQVSYSLLSIPVDTTWYNAKDITDCDEKSLSWILVDQSTPPKHIDTSFLGKVQQHETKAGTIGQFAPAAIRNIFEQVSANNQCLFYGASHMMVPFEVSAYPIPPDAVLQKGNRRDVFTIRILSSDEVMHAYEEPLPGVLPGTYLLLDEDVLRGARQLLQLVFTASLSMRTGYSSAWGTSYNVSGFDEQPQIWTGFLEVNSGK